MMRAVLAVGFKVGLFTAFCTDGEAVGDGILVGSWFGAGWAVMTIGFSSGFCHEIDQEGILNTAELPTKKNCDSSADISSAMTMAEAVRML